MTALFISDLHLTPQRPAPTRALQRFLRLVPDTGDSLYVMGDLFEYWAGDDDIDAPAHREVVDALGTCATRGIALYWIAGNRDFLADTGFTGAARMTPLAEPFIFDLYGERTVLLHGDTLCTDDLRYLEFRAKVRSPAWQQAFLAQSLTERKQIIAELQTGNAAEKQLKSEEIMDATVVGVEAAFKSHPCPRMIHGHTHRPARHEHVVGSQRCERWVLADWYETGSYLVCDAAGCRSVAL